MRENFTVYPQGKYQRMRKPGEKEADDAWARVPQSGGPLILIMDTAEQRVESEDGVEVGLHLFRGEFPPSGALPVYCVY